MHFNYIRFSGFRPYTGEVVVNFDALPGRILSVVGGNGSGKTRLLELLAGGVYRTMPTRGKVNALAADRRTVLEVGVTTDRSYVLKQIIDGQSGRAEAVVIDGTTGLPLTDSGKLPEFDAWVAKHLPPADVLFTTTFAPQGEGGFFALSKADRKHVMLAALMIDHYETLAENARTRLRDAQARLEVTLARYGELSADAGDIDALSAEHERLQAEASSATAALATARAALRKLEAEANAVDLQIQANQHARDNAARLDGELQQINTRLAANDEKRRQVNLVLGRRAEIEAAVAEVAECDDKLAKLAADIDDHRTSIAALSERIATDSAQIVAADSKRRRGSERAVALRLRLGSRAQLEAEVARLPEVEAKVKSYDDAAKKAEAEMHELQATTVSDLGDRNKNLRSGLVSVRDFENRDVKSVGESFRSVKVIAGDTLTTDDTAEKNAAELPAKIQAARAAGHAAVDAWKAERAVLEELKRAQVRLDELQQVGDDLKAAEQEIADAELEIANVEEHRETLMRDRGKLDIERDVIDNEHKQINARRSSAQFVAAEKTQLDFASTRRDELKTEARELVAERKNVEAERAGIKIETDPEPVDTSDAGLDVTAAEFDAQSAGNAAAAAATALDRARTVQTRLAELEAKRLADELEVADYSRLAFELGRDGLQALEIDAAGPELTELVNDLLHNCFGNRWTVEIETVRDAKSSKKQIEVFDGLVHDREEGDKTFEQLSGGQQVIIGEAFSLALTMLACRRAGILHPMLIRDETGAALDGEAGPAYVAMLRRAADIVGASKVVFVSHNPELHALADSQIYLVKGVVCDDRKATE